MNATENFSVARNELTQERALELFSYNPETGVVTRLIAAGNRAEAGSIVGSADKDGYLVVKVDGRACKVHRLIWLMVTGEWPAADIDHRNSRRADNRWTNLRDVPHSLNNQNQRQPRKDNKSGYLGVSPRPNGTFYASISSGGRVRHLGRFTTAEQAHAAYLTAKRSLHAGNTL